MHEGCRYFVWPKNNADFWKKKIMGNVERDKNNIGKLQTAGWLVIVVWECQLKNDQRKETLEAIEKIIRSQVISK